jgi:hypothetical protein
VLLYRCVAYISGTRQYENILSVSYYLFNDDVGSLEYAASSGRMASE